SGSTAGRTGPSWPPWSSKAIGRWRRRGGPAARARHAKGRNGGRGETRPGRPAVESQNGPSSQAAPPFNFLGVPSMSKVSVAGVGLAAVVAAGAAAVHSTEANVSNPLLAAWTGPYGGVPPFDKVKVEQFEPGLEASMAEALAEIDTIAGDPAPPTFDNTIAALERTGRTLDRVSNIF